ncbi:MAG: hypothetical protein A2Y40_05405 [Candidatus Margulisbacteria bacterium GWF2_35_9]|nr:MAG: hypothetical protein A2Y40_05405 [Candidatus Margulisbacteria bacterium GWF2_35_9]
MLTKVNHDALSSILGTNLFLLKLVRQKVSGVKSILKAYNGHIDGLNKQSIKEALQIIQSKQIAKVFLDGSNLGSLAKVIKKKHPKIEVITFFHNVEVRFFWGAFYSKMSFRSLAVLVVNYLAERKSVLYSDKRVCLSNRDSKLLKKIYARESTYITPMVLEDKMPVGFDKANTFSKDKYVLFVGGTFYANIFGIKWFVNNVVPHVDIKLYIVGLGFEKLREELEVNSHVKVIGAVDSLSDWYKKSQFVIAPIFDGSGMKTKVAEALMYGKKVVGTPEAFSGYVDSLPQAGWVCKTAEEFIEAINCAKTEITLPFDNELRRIYENKYSVLSAKKRLGKILND